MQFIKSSLGNSLAIYSKSFIDKSFVYLSIEPNKYDNRYSYIELKEIYDNLTQEDKYKVETVYWELSKKEDSRIDGLFYGKNHLFDNLKLTTRSLHRCGFLNNNNNNNNNDNDNNNEELIKINFTTRFKRNKTTNSTQYYSLGEKFGKDYSIGQCGYVNGMGCTIGWAGMDASKLSDSMLEGNDLHCVYLPSYVISNDNFSHNPNDTIGFCMDVIRHLTINAGEFSKTSCLIAQLWIDYLIDNPDKYFLQLCASDGGTFVSNAVKIMIQYCPFLLSRLSILLLAPGCILLPDEFGYLKSNQIVNLIKKEDILISKFATGANHAGKSPNVIYIPHNHTNDHPHNFTNQDYINAALPFIQNWKNTGKLII